MTKIKTAKLPLLLLVLLLAGAALVTAPLPVHAIYCWIVSADVTCCRLAGGQIVCTGDGLFQAPAVPAPSR